MDNSESSKTCACNSISAQGNWQVPLEEMNVPFLAVSRRSGLVVIVMGIEAGTSALRTAVSVQPLSRMAEVCGVAGLYVEEVLSTGTKLLVTLHSCSVLGVVRVLATLIFHGPTPPRHFVNLLSCFSEAWIETPSEPTRVSIFLSGPKGERALSISDVYGAWMTP